MSNKKLSRLLEPNLQLYFLCMAAFCGATATVSPLLALAEGCATLGLYVYFTKSNKKRRQGVLQYIDNLTGSVDTASKSTLINSPLPIMVFRPDTGEIIWSNENFLQLAGVREHLFEMRVDDAVPDFPVQWLLEGKQECPGRVAMNSRRFRVYGSLVRAKGRGGEQNLVATTYWVDTTEADELRERYTATRPVVAILMIDNYDDLMKACADTQRSAVLAQIDEKLSSWASWAGGPLLKTERDHYLFIFEEQHYEHFAAERFSVLDAIRDINVGEGVHPTLSIGVGKDADTMAELYKNANLSVEMALSRGGDQAVVKNRFNFEFYGGRGAEVESRGRVRTRVMAHSLSRLMEEASHIFVMGHRYADLDTIGAAAGICCIARKLGKSANIVLGDGPNASVRLLDRLCVLPEYAETLLSPAEAAARADQNSLLVIVDTNRPEQVEDRAMLESCGKIAIIDHHRRAATYIENPVMSYYEPAASSACELTAEIMERLLDDEDILPEEADAVLSGIVMDTKNFTIRTVERTFAAAAYLQRCGADTTRVKLLLQNGMEETLERYEILRTAKIYRGVAVAVPTTPQNRVVASQAADELLNIHDVTASVVIYPTAAGDIDLSARSIGSINVQVLLEELGGGGNKSAAGAQLGGVTLRDATNRLFAAIDHYLDTDQ